MKERFAVRLAQLRTQKGVSARDMSLSIGQSAGYINNIENGNNLPSMTAFFNICEYLVISPCDFFDYESSCPEVLNGVVKDLKELRFSQLENIASLVKDIRR